MSIFISILVFFIIFSILILIHEFGHFFMAKRAGIKVLEFGMGLPPRLYGKKIGETIYSVNAIPFGGFVKLYGEDATDPKVLKSTRSFVNKTVWQRIQVVIAGVLMNFILAFFLLSAGFSFGIEPLIVNGEDVLNNIRNGTVEIQHGLIVNDVVPSSSAFQLGFRSKDRILGFDDKGILTVDTFFTYLQKHSIRSVSVFRDGTIQKFEIDTYPKKDSGMSFYNLFDLPRVRVYGVLDTSEAFKLGIRENDIILRVNGNEIFFVDDILQEVSKIGVFQYEVLRGNEVLSLQMSPRVFASTIITTVVTDSLAESAGFMARDRILKVNDIPIYSFEDFRDESQKHKGEILAVTVYRGGQEKILQVTPDERGFIGVLLSHIRTNPFSGVSFYDTALLTSVTIIHPVQLPLNKAVFQSFTEMKRLSLITVTMFIQVLKSLIGEGVVPQDVAGPIGIARLTYVFVQEGFLSLVRFTALLSLSLGVINILPIPALDGGRLLFLLFELVSGKKTSPKWEGLVHTFGYGLLLLLIVLITYHDIVGLVRS